MDKKRIINRLFQFIQYAKTSEGQKKINSDFDEKVKKAKGGKKLLQEVKKLYKYFQDPNTSKSKKALIAGGLLYFIIPTDVISDFIPILGYLDDGVAIYYIWNLLEKELKDYEYDKIIDITSESEIINDWKDTD